MRILVRNAPPILIDSEESAESLRKELVVARDQIGGRYRTEVIEKALSAKPFPVKDEGTLVGGIQALPDPARLKVSVVPAPITEVYALVMELGRRPNKPGPPLAPIRRWVERQLGKSGKEAKQIAFLVRRKIHRKGIAARKFFARARADKGALKQSTALVLAAVRRWARRKGAA